MQVELQEHLVQVVLDGLRAEEELRSDVAVAAAPRRELCDPPLLRRQLVERARIARAGSLPCRMELLSRPFRPERSAHPLERLERRPKLDPRLETPLLPPQELAVGEMRARAFERRRAVREQPDALAEERFGVHFVGGCQRATT